MVMSGFWMPVRITSSRKAWQWWTAVPLTPFVLELVQDVERTRRQAARENHVDGHWCGSRRVGLRPEREAELVRVEGRTMVNVTMAYHS
jgi:hypothetical protein